MMEIFRILDELELLIKEGKKVPFSNGKSLIETHRFLDRLDRIRAILPEELEQARYMLNEKDKIITEACSQAEQYVEESKFKVARLVDDNEITKNAMGVAEKIVVQGEKMANEIKRDADEYAEGVLTHVEMVLRKGLEAVSQGKEGLNQSIEDDAS